MSNLKIGDKAPDFKGINQNGKEINLSDFKEKNLILYFYPKDNTPGCTAEACDLRDNYKMWISHNYEVIGISSDSEASHQKFINKNKLPFDLISDEDREILKLYGALGEKKMFGKIYDGILRKTFVIGKGGKIEAIFEKVKTKNHSNQILNEIK